MTDQEKAREILMNSFHKLSAINDLAGIDQSMEEFRKNVELQVKIYTALKTDAMESVGEKVVSLLNDIMSDDKGYEYGCEFDYSDRSNNEFYGEGFTEAECSGAIDCTCRRCTTWRDFDNEMTREMFPGGFRFGINLN